MFPFRKRRSKDQGWLAWPTSSTLGNRRVLLLSPRQFEREVARERVRSTRRTIPFCVLQVKIRSIGKHGADTKLDRRQSRKVIDLLHHNLRMTDEKGILSSTCYGVLLVDTPEMGGRAVLDRLTTLMNASNLNVELSLQVHDPEGFGNEDELVGVDENGRSRRRSDLSNSSWDRKPAHSFDSGSSAVPAPLSESRVTVVDDELTHRPSWTSRAMKRTLDLVGATTGLLLTSPFILAAMAAIKLTDGGPVFFCQTREGLNGRPFTIYKLRSMIIDAEKMQASLRVASHRDGPAFKISRDPRVTKVGHFLRATCLDELPQLFNVLLGDMSLVGPRPLPWHESRACERWHRRRLDVRPGLTCIWQVNKSKATTFDDWMRMDLRYIDRPGLLQDLRLIARTVVVPVTGRGGE
ncbi:sugar transferase [Neorhodopirellula pilleata]|uniref:Putative sugar transferase EpsL n=1 Tax=Neorhodopirellula pilleata TaxID=2714738 RepID=A0A5C5ZZP1_9BACT|nr:sugar transferase [Neorhodopirellula pilleata]TWT92540.1 putative sugar transferase EpsL [Neorhodopirellula pilleata]